jgi:multicomponent Na+:H+ antiporter subunit D
MSNILILPVLIPLLTGAFLLLFRFSKDRRSTINVTAVSLLMAVVLYIANIVAREGIVVLRFGDWQPPFGIMFTVDWLSMFML